MPTDWTPRLSDVVRGHPVRFTFDGEAIEAYEGETVASALLAAGKRTLRRSPRRAEPRGLFCVVGTCFDCVVAIDDAPGIRACMTPVVEGMTVRSTIAGDR